jgi:hypothetical protein
LCVALLRALVAIYYIASGGSDSNSGLSSGAPWQTISKVNAATLVAGDTVSFNRGDTFSGTLTITNSGTNGNPITIGAYGSGALPIISCGNARGVYLQNCSYVTVQDLTITGVGVVAATGTMADSSTSFRYGIDVESTGTGSAYAGITIQRCTVQNVFGGIFVHADAASTPAGFSGLTITSCTITEALGLGVYVYGSLAAASSGSPYFLAKGRTTHANITVSRCDITNVYACPSAVFSTNNYTGSGIVVSNTTMGTIQDCYIANCGQNNDDGRGGPVGIMTIETDGVTIQRCEINHERTNGADGTGIDMDGGTINGIVQRCYVHDCVASPFATGTFTGSNSNSGNVFRFNIAANNGGAAGVHAFGNAGTITIERNTIQHVPAGDYAVLHDHASEGGTWIYKNNIAITTGAKNLAFATNSGGGTGVFQGNWYYNTSGTYRFSDDTHTLSGGTAYTALAGFRGSTNLVIPPETSGGSDVGGSGDPLLSDVTSHATVHDLTNLNTLVTAYNPTVGSPVISSGVAGGTTAVDFHSHAQVTGTGSGAVEYVAMVTGPVFLLTRVAR